MHRYATFTLLAGALALAPMATPARAHHETRNLEVTLRLNDDSYCPNGRMWGREGRDEGRDDRVWASVSLRTTDGRTERLEGTRGQLTVRNSSGRVVHQQSFNVRSRINRRSRRVAHLRFRPSSEPGNYRVSVWVGRGTNRDSARFLVAYDRDACPRRRRPGRVVVRPRPVPIPPYPGPFPNPNPYPELQDNLRITMRVSQSCRSDRFDTATVTVTNQSWRQPIRVAGIASHGLEGMGRFHAVNRRPGYLQPGEHITFHARGQLKNGRRRAVAYVTNYPEVRNGRTIDVNCGSWLGGGVSGEFNGYFGLEVYP